MPLTQEANIEAAKAYAERAKYIDNNFGAHAKRRPAFFDSSRNPGPQQDRLFIEDSNLQLPDAAKSILLKEKQYNDLEASCIKAIKAESRIVSTLSKKYPKLANELQFPFGILDMDTLKTLSSPERDQLLAVKKEIQDSQHKISVEIEKLAKQYDVSPGALNRALNGSKQELSGVNVKVENEREESKKQPPQPKQPPAIKAPTAGQLQADNGSRTV